MYRQTIFRVVAFTLVFGCARMVLSAPGDDQYAVAANHYTHARWNLAIDEFQSFLRLYPEHSKRDDALFFVAEAYVQTGQYDQARAQFVALIEISPQYTYVKQAIFRTGECAYLSSRWDEAEKDLAWFVEKYPDDALCQYALPYLGEICIRRDDAKQAQEFYVKALNLFPEGPLAFSCRYGMARAFDMQGGDETAERFYRFVASKKSHLLADDALFHLGWMNYQRREFQKCAAVMQEFAESFADSKLQLEAAYWRGLSLRELGQPAEAVTVLEAFASEQPEHPLAAALRFAIADTLYRLGRVEEADRYLTEVQTDYATNDWADDSLQLSIQIAFDEGRYFRAKTLIEEFQERYPESRLRFVVKQTQGRVQLKEQDFPAAADTFLQLTASPADAETDDHFRATNWYLLALAQMGSKQYGLALDTLATAADLPLREELHRNVQMARATSLFEKGDLTEASQAFTSYLAAHPGSNDDAKVRSQLTVALAKLGRVDQAVASFDDLNRQHPHHELLAPVAHHVAEAAYAAERLDVAAKFFALLAEQGNTPEMRQAGLTGLAWTQLQTNNTAASADTFQQLLEQHPDSPRVVEAVLARARALEANQQWNAAIATYELVLEKYPVSEHAADAQFYAALLHMRLKQHDEAVKKFGNVVEQYPDFARRDEALYHEAWELIELQRVAEADALFQRLVSEHSESRYWADAAYRLAERAVQAGRDEEAIGLLDQIIAASVDERLLSHALYMHGQLAAEQGRWNDTAVSMQKVVELDVNPALKLPAQYWIAESYYRQGDYDQAGRLFSLLDAQTDDLREAWLGMIPLRRAQAQAHQKQWSDAYQLARTIADRFPDFAQQYEVDYLLGRCLSSQARFNEARAAYNRVIQSTRGGQSETAAMAQWMIGETYFLQQDYVEAIKAYYRVDALYSYPHWQAAALLQAAKCHELLQQWPESIQLYTQLLKDHGDTEFADEASLRLKAVKQKN
mgnify:CR=1 FL=1